MWWDNIKTCLQMGEACLNGVYGWYWEIATILAIVVIFNFVFKRLLFYLKSRFHDTDQLLKESFVTALYLPMSMYIWFFAALEILDFISLQVVSTTLFASKPMILSVGMALGLGWFLLRWKNHVTHYILSRNRTFKKPYQPATVDIIDKLATVGIIFLTILLTLELTGSNLNTIIAFGGISGLALAFASQEVIASFFGGLMTYITQPFIIGDWILLPEKNIEGHVEEIGWYMTKVRTFDKTPIYVPNSNFSKIVVVNPSRMSHRRMKEVVGLRYSDFPQLKSVMEDIKQMLRNNPDVVAEMTQGVYFIKFGDYSLDIEVSAYTYETTTEGFKRIKEQLFFAIADIVAKHNAEFAYPTSCVEINSMTMAPGLVPGHVESKDLIKGEPCRLNT